MTQKAFFESLGAPLVNFVGLGVQYGIAMGQFS